MGTVPSRTAVGRLPRRRVAAPRNDGGETVHRWTPMDAEEAEEQTATEGTERTEEIRFPPSRE